MTAAVQQSVFSWLIRPLVWCVLGAIGLIVVVGCMQVVNETELGWQLLMTALTLVLMFTLFIGATVVCAQRVFARMVMLPAILFVFLGELVLLDLIWYENTIHYKRQEELAQAAAITLIAAGVMIHSGVFAILPKTGMILRIGKLITVAALWCNALFVISILVAVDFFEDVLFGSSSTEWIGWIIISLQLLCLFTASVGTVVVPLLSILSSRKQYRSEWLRSGVTIAMACPKCEHRQTMRRGSNRCAACRELIRIELREPRCECGYLLFELKGDTCPECGRAVNLTKPSTVQPPPVVLTVEDINP